MNKIRLLTATVLVAGSAAVGSGVAHAGLSGCYDALVHNRHASFADCTLQTAGGTTQVRSWGYCPTVGYMYGPWVGVTTASVSADCPFAQMTAFGRQLR